MNSPMLKVSEDFYWFFAHTPPPYYVQKGSSLSKPSWQTHLNVITAKSTLISKLFGQSSRNLQDFLSERLGSVPLNFIAES